MARRTLGSLVALAVVLAVVGGVTASGQTGSAAAGGRPAAGRETSADGGSSVGSALLVPVGNPVAAGAEDTPPYDPCPSDDGAVAGEGPSTALAASIPSLPPVPLPGPAASFDPGPGDVPATFTGTILRPTDTIAFPGPRPAVVLLHGIDGDQCQMWWLAQYLAGAGYVTLALTAPTPGDLDPSYGVAIDAARSAVAYLGDTLENPFAYVTDHNDIGLAGWSEGSVAVSVGQGLPGMGSVRAVVALDDLRGSFLGDSGAPFNFCTPPEKAPVTPRVPALGFASDSTCNLEPDDAQPTLKLSGYDRWRQAGVPAVELPLAGYTHYDYDDAGPRLAPVAGLTLAWFDRWLGGDTAALQAFTACQLDGEPFADALSKTFRAAAYLPSLDVDSTDWGATLAGRCHQDPTGVGSHPLP